MALKTWSGSKDWCQALSESTTICMTDDDVGAGEKPWWIYLAQTEDTPPVSTNLPGKFLLLDPALVLRASDCW